jgi:hypothetical protein
MLRYSRPHLRNSHRYTLVAMERWVRNSKWSLKLVGSVEVQRGATVQPFLCKVAALNDNNKVVLVTEQ